MSFTHLRTSFWLWLQLRSGPASRHMGPVYSEHPWEPGGDGGTIGKLSAMPSLFSWSLSKVHPLSKLARPVHRYCHLLRGFQTSTFLFFRKSRWPSSSPTAFARRLRTRARAYGDSYALRAGCYALRAAALDAAVGPVRDWPLSLSNGRVSTRAPSCMRPRLQR